MKRKQLFPSTTEHTALIRATCRLFLIADRNSLLLNISIYHFNVKALIGKVFSTLKENRIIITVGKNKKNRTPIITNRKNTGNPLSLDFNFSPS